MSMQHMQQGNEDIEGEIVDSTALATLTKSEIDIQIATAHRYPRSVQRAVNEAKSMAMLNPQTAESMFYSLPRKQAGGGTKNITGPSVRLAEIFYACWGNMRVAARVIEENDKFVVAQGIAHDLERNVAISTEVRRRITDRNGRKYSDDMVIVTANAALAIARRNAIFQICPRVYVEQVLADAMKVVRGDTATLEQRRMTTVAGLMKKYGITEARVLGAVDKSKIGDIDLDDLMTLKGLVTAITEGRSTIDKAFPEVDPGKAPIEDQTQPASGKSRSAAIVDKVKNNKQPVEPKATAAQPPAIDEQASGNEGGQASEDASGGPRGEAEDIADGSDADTTPETGQEAAGPADLSTYEGFVAAVNAIAIEDGVEAAVVTKALSRLAVNGYPVKPQAAKSLKARQEVYDAMKHGAFDWTEAKLAD